MKATSSDPFHVVLLVLSLLAIVICGIACDRDVKMHPDASAAINSIGRTNLVSLWAEVAPFAAIVNAEDRLTRLAIDGQDVFAILAGQVIDAKLNDGELASTNVAQPLSNADSTYILAWISKCKAYEVCGYDVRSMPAYFRVFIRNNVCFVVLGNAAPPRYRDAFASQAKRGFTVRGDAFCYVTTGVFLSTERR